MLRARHVRHRAQAIFSMVAILASVAAAAPLTSIREVRDLPAAILANKPAVEVRGVITCVIPEYQATFVQDESAGIYLYRFSPSLNLAAGDEIELRGIAVKGKFSPMLDQAKVTRLGERELLPPLRVSLTRIASGEFDGERMETEGIVQRSSKRGGQLWLHIAETEGSTPVAVPLAEGEKPPDLLDARVQVRGVVTSVFKQDLLTGFQMFANGLSDITVVQRPSLNAFDRPVCSMAALSDYEARRSGGHRTHVRGIVILHWPGRATVLQDETGALLIERGAGSDVKVGDEIDVAGFLAAPGAENRLQNVEVRVLRSGLELAAAPTTLSTTGMISGKLVRVAGRVTAWPPQRDGETLITMASGNESFTAVMRDPAADRLRTMFVPGTEVMLTGVMRPASDSPGARHAIWLRMPADVSLLRAAPTSPWRWVVVASAVAGAVTVLALCALLLFAVRHRRAIAIVTTQQRDAEQKLEEMERQFRRADRDREYITQELHDNIVQSIFAVGLGIDEASRLVQKSPERVQERLGVAVQALNKIIRDVRAFISGLEPRGLEGHELKTALKSVLLASGEDQEARFSLQIDASAARELNSMQATELFNIAKEAMANAMRHSQARLTTVSLVPRGRGVRLEVADDGVGFDVNNVAEQGLGFRNLRNRARNIGAKLDIISAPGQGTRIVADIPISPHDDH